MDIKVDHVSKAYGEQQILRDLCCVFPEGKTTCIRGRSGCGKTTLIRLLLGLDIPDKGKIEGISDRKISAVFQEDRLCENLSAASNIRLVCTETISDRELEEAYKAVALQKPVRELSGGMRRRVSILRALLADSDCVIMDEPLRGLDEKTRTKTIDYILKKTEGKTLIFVTHEEQEAVWLKADKTLKFMKDHLIK
ncbi:ATP-binding cassette domain-containing protein [Ruminococcus sp. AF13-28]|nr:ATP-binding cassette domain-containing protein [Ruminococcus sp. AF13-37]RGW22918.1 ATP-binding cassette domain-containing protein [Ruminococcus sp. AF13-28]